MIKKEIDNYIQSSHFIETLWYSVESIVNKIINHPFNIQLAAGSLSIEKFRYYLQQDSLYLKDYSKSLSLLAQKAPLKKTAMLLLSYSKEGLIIEKALHKTFFKKFAIPKAIRKEPACLFYTNYLLTQCTFEPWEIGIAAMLPCFWIYYKVGNYILSQSARDNCYQEWIDTYSSPQFENDVLLFVKITEEAAKKATAYTRKKMKDAFKISTHLELLFCDAAFNLQKWE